MDARTNGQVENIMPYCLLGIKIDTADYSCHCILHIKFEICPAFCSRVRHSNGKDRLSNEQSAMLNEAS